MKQFHFILAVLCLAAVLPLAAESVTFRSGRILCAELSRTKPADLQIATEKLPPLPENRLYAALTIIPEEGRGISIYDYKLNAFGQDYLCIAIRDANGDLENAVIPASEAGGNNKHTLYFITDGALLGMKNIEPVELKCTFADKKVQSQRILFTNCGTRSFTSAASIPQSGKMVTAK